REGEAEARSAADLAVEPDAAVARADEPVDRCEPEARALSRWFGGEVGIEDSGPDRGRDATAGVGDFDQRLVHRQDRAQRDRAALGHRLARVDDEVPERVLEAAWVDEHSQIASTRLEDEADAGRHDPFRTPEEGAHLAVEVRCRRLALVRMRER